MIKRSIAATFALFATPLASENPAKAQVTAAVDAFFEALRSPDKTALAKTMAAESVIFIHDRRDPSDPKIRIVPVGEHLKGWEQSPPGTDEYMNYDMVQIDGTMAHVWGPYVFLLDGAPAHCGINSMSLAQFPDDHMSGGGWKVTNTSFTMTALNECRALGAPGTGNSSHSK